MITLKEVGKRFNLSQHEQFWALRGVTLSIGRGTIAGIVGRNGAGKSTLLNILAGLCPQTEGDVLINGRVSSLLTLGAGFQDELSGRENILLNASILGMDRAETGRKFRRIAEFSELDGYLREPLKNYSQGMRMRLGFSIAIHTDFDVLLIDEVLSVGDIAFQKKCYERISDFKRSGKTMVITTQSLDIIERLCGEVILLEEGRVEACGSPAEIVNKYRKLVNEKGFPSRTGRKKAKAVKWWGNKENWGRIEGTNELKITSVRFLNRWGREKKSFRPGERVTVKVEFEANEDVNDAHFGVALFREDGVYCYGPNTAFDGYTIAHIRRGRGWFTLEYKEFLLMPGAYRFSVAIWDEKEVLAYSYHEGYYKVEITGPNPDKQLLCLPQRQKVQVLLHKERAGEVSAAFVDEYGEALGVLNTGERATLRVNYNIPDKSKKYLLKIGISRQDGIYCQGLLWKVHNHKNSLYLIYPRMNLLNGCYYVSVSIYEEGTGNILTFQARACTFRAFFPGDDHGTVYLRHQWWWSLP